MIELDAHGLVVRAAPNAIPNGPTSVARVLDAPLAAIPDHEALVGRHARYTYAELDRAVDAAVAGLHSLGVQAGDRIAASLPNETDIVIAFLAAMRVGAIWVGINRALAPPEKAYLLCDSGATVLLSTPEVAATLLDHHTPLRVALTVDRDTSSGTWTRLVTEYTPAAPPRRVIDPHAPAAIAYTSGTTGFPKGAVHSQHNMLWPGADARENDPAPPDERHGVMLPLTLLNLQLLGPLFAFLKGTTCVCVDRTDPLGLIEWIRNERITRITAVPAVLHDLLTHPDVTAADLVTLRRPECGGSATPQWFRELFRSRFGTEVLTGYGLTEAPTAVTREMPGDGIVAGCSGRPFAPVEIVIVDDSGHEQQSGTVGEICVRARRSGAWAGVYTPFLGYWNQPDATRHALRDALLRTDDLGYLDDEGRLFVKDRRNDVVIRGGANVYPAEIEQVLHDHAGVAAAAVFGVPHQRLGEIVVAVIERRDGGVVDETELRAACQSRLARYKIPERWAFVERFERNAMGKINKAQLRALFE